MRIGGYLTISLLFLSTAVAPAAGQAPGGWLERFVSQLDPGSEIAGRIGELGSEAGEAEIVEAAATYFRSRPDPIPLWVVPRSDSASTTDLAWADQAITHVITDRSGTVRFGDNLPWFNAPQKLATLSRFPHLDYLMRSYVSTGDERYAAAMVRDMVDFMENVPLSRASEFHVQMPPDQNPWNWVLLQWRVKRWIDALTHLKDSPSLPDDTYLRLVQYLWDEVNWLVPRKVLGLHNGTLGNVSTILYAARNFPESRHAAEWLDDATSFFDSFLDSAFYPGEFLIELTIGYSEGTLLMCLLMHEALPDSPVKERTAAKLEALVDAHVGVMKPDRSLPRYGDHGVYDITERVLRRSARLFSRPDLALLADQPNAKKRADGKLSFPFKSNPYYLSGYYAMRDGWDVEAQYLSMDAGPFGTNHHHGDKLSVTVSADGAAFIVDPGTSLYTSLEPGPRYDLRPGFLHNVITIDGVDPNTGWDRHYGFDVLENRWVTNSTYDFLEGTYEYRNNLLDVLWRRSVLFVKGEYWIVLDALYGEGAHRVESNLQFDVDIRVDVGPDRIQALAPNRAMLDLVEAFETGWSPEVVIGDTVFPGTTFLLQYPTFVDWTRGGRGWVGTFGNETRLPSTQTLAAPALLRSGTVNLPIKSLLVITPSKDKAPRRASVEVLDNKDDSFEIEISSAAGTTDRFHWMISPWTPTEKLADDAGWWFRTEEERITKVIIMNAASVAVSSGRDALEVDFEAPFEGVIERTDTGWVVIPDRYNAVTPSLLTFHVESDGAMRAFEWTGDEPMRSAERNILTEQTGGR